MAERLCSLKKYGGGSGAVQCKADSVELSTSTTTKVILGFKPKYLTCRIAADSTSLYALNVYDERYSTTKFLYANSTGTNVVNQNLPYTGSGQQRIASIDNDGFTLTKSNSTYKNCDYVAIG